MDKPTVPVANPNASQAMTAALDCVAQTAAGSSVSVVTTRSNNGPYTAGGVPDAALAAAGRLEVVAAHEDPLDARERRRRIDT